RQHASAATSGKADAALEQRGEPARVVVDIASAVLVVDAGQQAGEIERTRRVGGIDGSVEFVGGPAGGGDGQRVFERDAFGTQCAGELVRPAASGLDAFADGVGVAEGKIGERHPCQAVAGLIAAVAVPAGAAFVAARRASTRSMRRNTSRSCSGSGSRVTRKWLR